MIYFIIIYLAFGIYETCKQYKNYFNKHNKYLNFAWYWELLTLILYSLICPVITLVIFLRLLYLQIIYGK